MYKLVSSSIKFKMQITKSKLEKMPKAVQRSLSKNFSKIKQSAYMHITHSSLSSKTNKILAGCKHPKSLLFSLHRRHHQEHHQPDQGADPDHNQESKANEAAATLEDIDRFLIENFRSLYGEQMESGPEKDHQYYQCLTSKKDKGKAIKQKGECEEEGDGHHEHLAHDLFEDSLEFFTSLPPGLCKSHRFFVSPGSSSSLMEEVQSNGNLSEDMMIGSTSTNTTPPNPHAMVVNLVASTTTINADDLFYPVGDCIVLLTTSPNPHGDFRQSMHDIVAERIRNDQEVDWKFMEELLFCYLRLNDKKQYRFIISAYTDLLVHLRQPSSSNEGGGVLRIA